MAIPALPIPELPKRKREIVDLAAGLMADRGYHGASLRDIGDAAGIRRGSLYAHFDSKDEIVVLILVPALQALHAILTADDIESDGVSPIEHRIRAAVRCCIEHRAALLILLQDRSLLDEIETLRPVSEQSMEVTALWLSSITRAQHERTLRADLTPTAIVFGLYGLLLAVLSDRHKGLEKTQMLPQDPDALASVVVTLFLDGATAR